MKEPELSTPSAVRHQECSRTSRKLERLLEAADAKLLYQQKSFDALLSISESLGPTPTIEKLFQQAIEPIYEITGFSTIALRLYDAQHHHYILQANKGFTPQMIEILTELPRPIDEKFYTQAFETKKPVLRFVPYSESRNFRSMIVVPLLGGNHVVGTMDLGTREDRDWTEEEINWLALVGRYIGEVVYQIQLSEKLQGLAAIQERERIAQELHDGSVQLVSSVHLWAQEAQCCLEQGNLEEIREILQKIEQNAYDAFVNLREEIFGLHEKAGFDEDIVSIIKKSLLRFERQWAIQTSLSFESVETGERTRGLSIAAEIQLLRIIQETLTNIRRHSKASHIKMTIKETFGALQVTIQDNGQGFSPEGVSQESFGLRIMSERAASVGGMFKVTSNPGKGTLIEIALPKQKV